MTKPVNAPLKYVYTVTLRYKVREGVSEIESMICANDTSQALDRMYDRFSIDPALVVGNRITRKGENNTEQCMTCENRFVDNCYSYDKVCPRHVYKNWAGSHKEMKERKEGSK